MPDTAGVRLTMIDIIDDERSRIWALIEAYANDTGRLEAVSGWRHLEIEAQETVNQARADLRAALGFEDGDGE